MTALKSLLFFVLAPGMVAGFIPLGLLRTGLQVQTSYWKYAAYPFWLIGLVVLLWCFWDFLAKGKGTPAPVDPPKQLVATGLYKYVRNPMYVGVTLVNIGHFVWFGYWGILLYTVLVWTAFHLFVTFYEEPNLHSRFGLAYEEYLNNVPRWIPRVR